MHTKTIYTPICFDGTKPWSDRQQAVSQYDELERTLREAGFEILHSKRADGAIPSGSSDDASIESCVERADVVVALAGGPFLGLGPSVKAAMFAHKKPGYCVFKCESEEEVYHLAKHNFGAPCFELHMVRDMQRLVHSLGASQSPARRFCRES